MQPRYEEKTYESYFNTELDRRATIYFPFGQVQEGSIGADAAALSRSRRLWWRLGQPFWFRVPFSGVDLKDIADEMERLLRQEIRNIPRMRANLLFQYKRPEMITSPLGSEWAHWNQTYFRYNIYSEQQNLLEHLHGKFGGQALILYAAPALEDVDALVQAKLQERLIECSNFRKAIELSGHHRNTYVKAGTHSIACSDPVRLEKFDFLGELTQLAPPQDVENAEVIVEFAAAVRQAALESSHLRSAFRSLLAPYLEIGAERFKLFFAIVTMGAFRQLTGTQWAISIEAR